jgi:hypothetical protein
VVLLLDDNLKVGHGACSPPLEERVGTNCVCMCKVLQLMIQHGVVLKRILWTRRVYHAIRRKYEGN